MKIGFDFYQLTEESNPGRLGEKREHYLCAMPSPYWLLKIIAVPRSFKLRSYFLKLPCD